MRRAAERLAILSLVVGVGWILVPAHRATIWMDPEFQGWMAAAARRLYGPLYVDGSHSPMPPLPFLLERLLAADWVTESALHLAFQGVLLLGLHRALLTVAPGPVPFCATVAATPVILALPKIAIHDSMAQALAAWAAAAVVESVLTASRRATIVGGALTALCLLSKQSTGIGLLAGSSIAYAVARRERLREHLAAAVATFAVALIGLSPFANLGGLLEDVFQQGAEPKGGLGTLWARAGSYLSELARPTLVFAPVAVVLLLSARGRARRATGGPLRVAAVVGALAALALGAFWPALGEVGRRWSSRVLWVGFYLCVLGAIRERRNGWGVLALVLAPAALAHNLSAAGFRWMYDNNPLIGLAAAWLLRDAGRLLGRWTPPVALALSACAWLASTAELALARRCVERWPEVAYLDGARMRPEAGAMRGLVALVRSLAEADDTVLLLPEDPDVAAWFERPRPRLTSLIVFYDQYWDRFVDEDVRRLLAEPPRVIVLGPRTYAPRFEQAMVHGRWGTGRLIEAVTARLLPGRYDLHAEHEIPYRGGVDVMAVYVRRDAPS